MTSFGDELATSESFSSPKIRPFSRKVEHSDLSRKHSSFASLVKTLESSDEHSKSLKEARAWVGNELFGASRDSIKSIRLEKGLSQTQLANLLETSQSHVARIESGKSDIIFSTFEKLCAALEVQPNQLFQILKNNRDA